MKLCKILALCAFQAAFLGTVALAPEPIANEPIKKPIDLADPGKSTAMPSGPASFDSNKPIFPRELPMQVITGGKTIRTWQMPPDGERVQYMVKTNGRPLKAHIEMWQGPQRKTHQLDIDLQDGLETPYRATLKFKKGPQVLRIMSNAGLEYPLHVGVEVPSKERAAQLDAHSKELWTRNAKTLIQGGSIHSSSGGGGAVRTFKIPDNWKSVQVMYWSKDVSKKSSKAIVEVLQGPNTVKQKYDLSISGSSQPYHCLYQTPGPGWTLRLRNKNYLEFPYEVVVEPYEIGDRAAEWGAANKQWWE